MSLENDANQILSDSADHADLIMRLVNQGQGEKANRAEFEAHLLKTLAVIGWALLETMPSRFQPPYRRFR